MTFWALLFLILFLSAFVAYLGDKVAKWAGKRHYRLFGLRPRQTATLVAVFTGVGIALFSYLGFLLVFREARVTILEAEAVRKERDGLKAERDALLRAKEALEAEASRALAELNALRSEAKELSRALEEAAALRKRLQAEASALEARVRALEAEKKRLTALLEERERALREKEGLLAQRAEALKALEEAVRRAEAERKRLEREKARLEADLTLLEARLGEAQKERQALKAEAEALRARLEEARKELRRAEERVRDLVQQAEVLQGERGQLSARLARLSQGLSLGEVRLGAEEGRVVLERVAERRALSQGFRGVELLLEEEVRGPGVAVLEGAGYQEGRLLVRVRFYPERRVAEKGKVLASATFRLSTPAKNQEVLERLGKEARERLLEAGFPPEYATFPSPEELARGLALLEGKRGVVRVGVVAVQELRTSERPLLAFGLLGGPPGPEVPVPTREVP